MAEKLVVDASVAAKWFLKGEADSEVAVDILAQSLAGDLDLHAPGVFPYEVAALLAKACGGAKPRLKPEDARDALVERDGII